VTNRARARAGWLLLAAACEGPLPTPPTRDGGLRPEIEASVPSPDAGYERPVGGPRLPPADLEVVLPYLGPEVALTLDAVADTGVLDLVLSIDTTGSFGGEIDALQADLEDRIVSSLAGRVPSLAVAVGRFEDFPLTPFGADEDRPFTLLTPITTDLTRVRAAVASLDRPLGRGGDEPEAGAEALWQIATGRGYEIDGRVLVAPFGGRAALGGGTLGGVGFRPDSLRAVVHVTDALTHAPRDYAGAFPGTHTLAEAAAALRALDVRAVSIVSGPRPRAELEGLALETGATIAPDEGRCPTGRSGAFRPAVGGTCPLVFDIGSDGAGLSEALVDALDGLLDGVAWREVWGEAEEDRLGFVEEVVATAARPADGTAPPSTADLRPAGDGVADTFVAVRAGTEVEFRVTLRNEHVQPADYDQIFRVVVRLVGDGRVLNTRTIRVIVPRGRLDGG